MKGSTLAFGGGMLAAGLAVGGAVGYLLSSSAVTTVPLAPAGAPGSEAAKSPPPGAEVRAAPSAAPKTAAADRGPLATGTGEGVITGSVVGPDGAPLAGVLVRATPDESGPGVEEEDEPPSHGPPGSPPPREDIARRVGRYSQRLERQQAGLREAETDSTGQFTLAGLPAKAYRVDAWLAGWRIDRTDGIPWVAVPVGGRCEFKGAAIRSLPVSVLLPDGKAPDRARIAWKPAGGGDGDSAEWSPGSPGIEIEPGTYEIVASTARSTGLMVIGGRMRNLVSDEDEGLYHSEPQTVTVGDGDMRPLTFQLVGRPGIQVKVVFASADHPRAVRIAALRLGPGVPAEPSRLLEDDDKVKSEWLTEKYEGALVGLEPGTYLVGVTFRGGQVGPTTTVALADHLVTQEIQVPAGELRDSIRLWIRGPDGAAVTDAEITVGCRGSEGRGSTDVHALAGTDGSYRVEHYEEGAPSQGSSWSTSGDDIGSGRTYYVEVTSALLGKAEAVYDPLKDREVTIQFAAPAIVRVTVSGFAASPDKERVILTLESKEEGGGGRREDVDADVSADGTATFPAVKPGRYEVVLRLTRTAVKKGRYRSRWNATEIGRVAVTLAAGVTPVSIPLVATADLVVTFEGDAPDLHRVGADGVPRYVRQARGETKDNSISFKDLASGRYVLVSRTGLMAVDAPASSPVAFQPTPFNAYFLEVTDKGYVKELGLRTGDLVVGLDGTEFKDKQGMDAALLSAMGRATARITIQRDGARFEITADAKMFEQDRGSIYQPWVR